MLDGISTLVISGVYFYCLETNNITLSEKIVLVRKTKSKNRKYGDYEHKDI
jgi:hypothetical protein